MPRPGPRRPNIGVRLSDEELARIDKLAERAGRNRSEQIRTMLAYAQEHMPKGWKP